MKQVYLDSEDDITTIITKIEASRDDEVALIPPKRSTALQSIVNLKLLKKASASFGKKLTLITRDRSTLQLAGRIKILTAPNLETEPSVPEIIGVNDDLPSDVIDSSATSEVDLLAADAAAGEVKQTKTLSSKLSKSKRVPDFDKFKKWGLIGLVLILLLGAGVWAAFFLAPRGVVTIEGRTQEVSTKFSFEVTPDLSSSQIDKAILVGESQQLGRTLTSTFPATGEKTVGKKASGSVRVVNCFDSTGGTIPSGTAFVAENGFEFLSTEDASVPPAVFSGGCSVPGEVSVPVVASKIGTDYNIGPADFTISGYDYDANGGNMTGGESNKVAVITAADVAKIKTKLLEDARSDVKKELNTQFKSERFVIQPSFNENVTEETVEPGIDKQAKEGRIILQVKYSLLSVLKTDLVSLLEVKHIVSGDNQELGVVDNGFDKLSITKQAATKFMAETNGVLGPKLDFDKLKTEIAGQGYSEVIKNLESRPNVAKVSVDLSPFWVSSLPSDPAKIDIKFDITNPYDENSGN